MTPTSSSGRRGFSSRWSAGALQWEGTGLAHVGIASLRCARSDGESAARLTSISSSRNQPSEFLSNHAAHARP